MRENGVNPDYSEHARADYNYYRRHQTLAYSARSGDRIIHKRRNEESETDDFKLFHARRDNVGVAVEKP